VRRLLVLLAVAALVACGKVGPPVAPEIKLPQPVRDLSAVIEDGAIALSWTNPTRRADNTRLKDLVSAHVYRAEDTGAGEPKAALLSRRRIPGYTEIATLDLVPSRERQPEPGGPVIRGNHVRLEDRQELTYGNRYSYVVVTEDGQQRLSPPSPRTTVVYIAPPEAPPPVRAVPGEHEVRLEWDPPSRFVDGTPTVDPLVYEVLRAGQANAPPQPITQAPVEATRFVDQNLENDHTYFYVVRALRRQDATLARGPASELVAATPRDMTPPGPPTELVAIPGPDGVSLSWKASPDADVATYIVYRAPGAGTFVRVGSARAPLTTFLDRNPGRGTFRYAVTAQDEGAQPNESGRSNEVTVRLP
jgi:hypothetical protein